MTKNHQRLTLIRQLRVKDYPLKMVIPEVNFEGV